MLPTTNALHFFKVIFLKIWKTCQMKVDPKIMKKAVTSYANGNFPVQLQIKSSCLLAHNDLKSNKNCIGKQSLKISK